jgi:Flp pilus assembly protein TadG
MSRREKMGYLPFSVRAMRVWRARQGLAAMELAITAPAVVLLISGVISVGSVMWARMQVGNAARAGAVYVAKNGLSNQAGFNGAISGATQLGTAIAATSVPAPFCGCPDVSQGVVAATCGSQCPTGVTTGRYVTVQTRTVYTPPVPIPGMGSSVTLNGTATVRVDN